MPTKQRSFLCNYCERTFKTEHGRNMHQVDVHMPDAPVDLPGKWVSREEFTGEKSFGYFKCCSRSWVSAHARKRFRQGCQACENLCFATFMWVNDPDQKQRNPPRERDDDKPHDTDRCEACRITGNCLTYNGKALSNSLPKATPVCITSSSVYSRDSRASTSSATNTAAVYTSYKHALVNVSQASAPSQQPTHPVRTVVEQDSRASQEPTDYKPLCPDGIMGCFIL